MIIVGMVLVSHHLALVLFDPGCTYSYVSADFTSHINIMCESFTEPICVFTWVGKSLVMNRVYQGCIVTFMGRDTVADLVLLDIVGFNVILDMD